MRPSGTVTFLFTDIEGSTRLWELEPEGMRSAIAQHDALLSDTFQAHNGFVFKTVGDAFCVAFSNPSDAVASTIAAQERLSQSEWPIAKDPANDLCPKVRMALLTGHAEERGGDYFGQPLNRVARLLGLAAGGQVIASHEVADAAHDFEWTNLGTHRLRDLMRPVNVFQLRATGLPLDIPPLKSLDSQPTN